MEADASQTEPSTDRATLAEDARAVAWWVLVGAAAGAIAGFLVGGVGGRLAMLGLRLTSPETVVGVLSDDGFEIGVLTTDTLQLVAGMTMFGAINGIAYAALRGSIPRRLRLPLWSLVSAAFVGAAVIHEDGVDFTLLEPVLLAIVLFVLLPGAAAALVVVLVERWADREPFADRRLTLGLCASAIVGTVAVLLAGLVVAIGIALRASGLSAPLGRAARVLVPVALVAVSAISLVDLVQTTSRIL